MQRNLIDEIKYLRTKIKDRKNAYDKGLKNDIEFGQLKKIFCEIKALNKSYHAALQLPFPS